MSRLISRWKQHNLKCLENWCDDANFEDTELSIDQPDHTHSQRKYLYATNITIFSRPCTNERVNRSISNVRLIPAYSLMGNCKNTETDLQWTKAATWFRANHFGEPRSVIVQRYEFKTNAMRYIYFQLTLTKWFFILVVFSCFKHSTENHWKYQQFFPKNVHYLKILGIINWISLIVFGVLFFQVLDLCSFLNPNFNWKIE